MDRPNGQDADGSFQVLAHAHWPGLEFLLCREDIRQPTHWAIGQPRHTLIVHLGGVMRELSSQIEGAGACNVSPSPGDIWLVPADHRYASEAHGQLITYAELRIAPDAAVGLPGADEARLADLRPRLGHRDEFLYHSVAQLARLVPAGDDLAAMMADRLQALLRQHLFRDYRLGGYRPLPARRPVGLSPAQARQLSDYIDAHLGERIVLADLAVLVGLGQHGLLAAFRRAFGTTPVQYLVEQRLARARWLLLNTRQDIAEIALATGFASHSHFSATFRRRLGISPRQLRDGLRTVPLSDL